MPTLLLDALRQGAYVAILGYIVFILAITAANAQGLLS
jgi:hypothetical protein